MLLGEQAPEDAEDSPPGAALMLEGTAAEHVLCEAGA